MRRAAVAITVVVATVAAAAIGAYVSSGYEPVTAPDIKTHTQPSDPTGMPHDMAASNNEFAVKFYKRLPVNGNVFFSPASMYVAFSALYEGARGDTAAQMQGVFGFDPNDGTRHNSTAYAMTSINRDDPDAILEIANALWIADWFAPSQPYLGVARGTYLADVETVNFGGDAVNRINQWASDKTHGKIEEVITRESVGPLTTMILSNAIYFKGTWINLFPEDATRESGFWTSDEHVKTDFMNVEGSFEHVHSDGAHVLKMPYEGDRLSMLIILPDERNGLAGLAGALSAEQMAKWSEGLRRSEVFVSMPKFEMRDSHVLNPILIGMGMTDVFDPGLANLGGIGSDPDGANLYVDSALQYTYINVDEEGTEAAAVTIIDAKTTSETPPIPRFVADRPFLFVIQDDETGMMLFMGRVADPTS